MNLGIYFEAATDCTKLLNALWCSVDTTKHGILHALLNIVCYVFWSDLCNKCGNTGNWTTEEDKVTSKTKVVTSNLTN